MTPESPTLTPKAIVDSYRHAYVSVYKIEPHVHYAGNGWYRVNDDLVHRFELLTALERLREIERSRQTNNVQNIVHRLIAKLRNL